MPEIIVFGHGRYYKKKESAFTEKYKVMAFLDNAVGVENVEYDNGIPIYNPRKIVELKGTPIAIMSSKYYEMLLQLFELDGSGGREIIIGTNLEPAIDSFEELLHRLNCEIITMNDAVGIKNDKGGINTFENEEELKEYIRKIETSSDPFIRILSDMPVKPISRRFGLERGHSIARYYIDEFIEANKSSITDDVLEVADRRYTNRYGVDVKKSMCLHVNGWGENVIKADLETGDGIEEESCDCFICTQTLLFTYDVLSVVKNVYCMLKKGGTALITVPGITHLSLYDYDNWGQYWSFTDMSLRRLLEKWFDKNSIQIETYGNMKSTIGYLYGLTVEDIKESDLKYRDNQYQLIIAAKVVK